MSHRSAVLGVAFSCLMITTLGCSLVGRMVSQVADDATGGAVSTIESLQSGMATAMATLPAEMPGLPEIPGLLPGDSALATEAAPGLGGEATISGNLSYPSEGIPALEIVVFAAQTEAAVATLETAAGQSTYSLSVPYGAYYVVAYTLDGRLAGGYTSAVMCGLSVDCTDHTLIPVVVAPGYDAERVDPADWYAPEGSFPAMP